MKQRITGVIKVACFLVLLLVCFIGTTRLFQRKDSVIKYTDFFEQDADFDVLFFGSSHVVNGVFPMELWEDYGIVSYNCGGHGHQLATTYWHIQNILEHTTPQLIVMDIFGIHYDAKYSAAEQLHESFDIMPLNMTKYRAVQDLFDDPESEDYDDRWAYFWDFGVYHTRWNDLEEKDFNYEVNREKGAESRIDVAVPLEFTLVGTDKVYAEDSISQQYLCKIIEDCQARGIDILLTHVPYPTDLGYQEAANMTYKVAAKYNVPYIDFVQMNNVVEYTTDCYDVSSHLNPSGARKVTDYLGRYIKQNYDIPDRRQDAEYEHWHEDYADYVELKYENLKAQTELDNYLMLLHDENVNATIYISAESGYLQNFVIHRLLDNAALSGGLANLAQVTAKDSDYLLVVDNTRAEAKDFDLCVPMQEYDTSMGQIIATQDEAGNQSVWINDRDILASEQENSRVLVKIVVYDAQTGELVSEFTQETASGN